jgi:SAM-dependent methyltransferase
VLEVYDDEYAAAYDDRFLLAAWPKQGADFEADVLRGLLRDGSRWLDVGCGTGYFLSLFPEVSRAGIDLSPSMLERARAANPDALFFEERDFREDVPEWRGAWSVVSCMWTAYNYVQSVLEVEQLVANMVRWTEPGGAVFIPVMDLEDIRPHTVLPYEEHPDVWGGTIALTSITWTWDEPGTGKRHEHLVAPHVGHFVRLLERDFTTVEVVRYPLFMPGFVSRKAVVATGRREPGEQGRAEVIWHPVPRHPDEEQVDRAGDHPSDEPEPDVVAEVAPPAAVDLVEEQVVTSGPLPEPEPFDVAAEPPGPVSLSSTSTPALARELARRIRPWSPSFRRGARRRLARVIEGRPPGA